MAKSRNSANYKARFKRGDWQLLRGRVMWRDEFRCQICGEQNRHGIGLQIHHYHYATFGRESLDDLVTLCVQCHKKADKERITHPHLRYKYER